MSADSALTLDSDICRIVEPLSVKFVVDFANGIDVARDHLRVQKKRQGFFSRLYDGISGQGAKRQIEVNANLIDAVEGALVWLNELTETVTLSHQAILQLNKRVDVIVQHVTSLASYSLQSRQKIERLAVQFEQRMDGLTQRVDRIEMEQSATRQLDVVMDKWAAGHYGRFSAAERCYLVFEELRWGAFGDYCAAHNDPVRADLLSRLANRSKIQLERDLELHSEDRVTMHRWRQNLGQSKTLENAAEALQYLGDWSNPEKHPFAFTISQRPSDYPMQLPKICHAARLSNGISAEIFGEMNNVIK